MNYKKTLYLSFTDEGGNKKNITIPEPSENVSSVQCKQVGDLITQKKMMYGKVGKLAQYNGAFLVTRTQKEI